VILKVLLISAVFPPEPVVSAQLSYDIAIELAKYSNVTILCPRPSRPIGFSFNHHVVDEPFNINIVDSYICPEYNFIGRMRESWSFGKKCSQYLRKHHGEIDTLYINSWPLLAQYLIIKTAKRYKIKTTIHIQDLYPESLSNKLPLPLKKFTNWILLH